jgi:hypothetical protein
MTIAESLRFLEIRGIRGKTTTLFMVSEIENCGSLDAWWCFGLWNR